MNGRVKPASVEWGWDGKSFVEAPIGMGMKWC
jgi:hypothetical protein